MAAPAPVLLVSIRAPIAPEDVDGLCARVCRAVNGRGTSGTPVVLDVCGIAADASALCALARLALAARRGGWEVRLRRTSAELRELIAFAGLEDVVR